MRIIFLKNYAQNTLAKLVPDRFLKASKLSLSLNQQSELSCSLLLFYSQVEDQQKIVKLMCELLAFNLFKAFL